MAKHEPAVVDKEEDCVCSHTVEQGNDDGNSVNKTKKILNQ